MKDLLESFSGWHTSGQCLTSSMWLLKTGDVLMSVAHTTHWNMVFQTHSQELIPSDKGGITVHRLQSLSHGIYPHYSIVIKQCPPQDCSCRDWPSQLKCKVLPDPAPPSLYFLPRAQSALGKLFPRATSKSQPLHSCPGVVLGASPECTLDVLSQLEGVKKAGRGVYVCPSFDFVSCCPSFLSLQSQFPQHSQ